VKSLGLMCVDGRRPDPDEIGRVGDIGRVSSVCNNEVKRVFACSTYKKRDQRQNENREKHSPLRTSDSKDMALFFLGDDGPPS